jgi:hypothetical protein
VLLTAHPVLTLMPILVALAAAAPAAAPPGGPAAVALGDLEPGDGVLANPSFDLVVVEVQEVRGGGDPVEATVLVREVVRGRARPGETAVARWDRPEPAGRERVEPPAPGTRLLAAGIGARLRDGSYQLSVARTFAASAANLEIARRTMARPAPSPWPVVLAALGGWVSIAVARAVRSSRARAPLAIGAVASAVAAVGLYAVYERNMSPYYTIRVDLLFVWPAVAAALLVPAGVWWLLYRRRPGAAGGRVTA